MIYIDCTILRFLMECMANVLPGSGYPQKARPAQEFQSLGSGTSVSGRADDVFNPNGCDVLQPLVL